MKPLIVRKLSAVFTYLLLGLINNTIWGNGALVGVDPNYFTPKERVIIGSFIIYHAIVGLLCIVVSVILTFREPNFEKRKLKTFILMFFASTTPLGVPVAYFHISDIFLAYFAHRRKLLENLIPCVIFGFLGILGDPLVLIGERNYFNNPNFYLNLILPFVIAFFLAHFRRGIRLDAQNAKLNAELIEQRAHQAKMEERLRISRDMHDSLSHRLSLISLHSGALDFRTNLRPEERHQLLQSINQQANLATEDLRELLSTLRENPYETDPRFTITDLVEEARAAGQSITLEVDGLDIRDLAALPLTSRHTINRFVQEALTNARKHAPGEQVTLRVTKDNDLILSASNPGSRSGEGTGQGLIGINERAALCGGRVSVSDHPFTIRMELPWNPSA
ncbi:sensor histidine kinase [Corynebacterium sp. H130]|uniref:sensor histidine kinase n=1 Tax=Corynebacterium sp. H130 TaxID=3133444 RepID=UPI0030AB1E2E